MTGLAAMKVQWSDLDSDLQALLQQNIAHRVKEKVSSAKVEKRADNIVILDQSSSTRLSQLSHVSTIQSTKVKSIFVLRDYLFAYFTLCFNFCLLI